MRDRRKASATRDGGGFQVRIPRPRDTDFYELYVHDDGKIDGLPGTDDDVVLLFVAESEISAEGWPSVAKQMMRVNDRILHEHGNPHY